MGYKKGEILKTAFETYTILALRGSGGAGEVFEACDSDGVPCAVKILDPARTTATRLKRFKNEINFCTKNTHQNIIRVQGSGVTDRGDPFYVMPLFAGTLRELMLNRVVPQAVLPYFGQILDGLEAAHLQGVWHRDIKPENVLFRAETKTLVVADFGIAHFEEEELLTAVETKNNDRLANFLYAAPEQKTRGQRVDSKADIYALGLILNEMFSGAVPLGTSFRKVSDVVSEYSYLDGLIELMLRQDPAVRPSISDVKRELISRGNEFLSLQRLNSLKSEIIPETEVDDPLTRNPVGLADTDYRGGHLIFRLTTSPPPKWIEAFRQPREQFEYYGGAEPISFNFNGNEATVPMSPGMSPSRLQAYMKHYIELANRQYAALVIAEHTRKLARERDELRRKALEEERRLEILRQLRS